MLCLAVTLPLQLLLLPLLVLLLLVRVLVLLLVPRQDLPLEVLCMRLGPMRITVTEEQGLEQWLPQENHTQTEVLRTRQVG